MTAVPKLIPGEAGCLVRRIETPPDAALGGHPWYCVTVWRAGRVWVANLNGIGSEHPSLALTLQALEVNPHWFHEITDQL